MNRPGLNIIKKTKLYPDFLVKEINSKLNYYIGKYKYIPRILRDALIIVLKMAEKDSGRFYARPLQTAWAVITIQLCLQHVP